MKKTLAILLAVVMAITLFTACGDKPAPTPDTKTGSVYYLNFKPEAGEAVHREDRCSRNRSDCGFRYL